MERCVDCKKIKATRGIYCEECRAAHREIEESMQDNYVEETYLA